MGFKPGPPPDNEPSAFEFLTDNRLLHNPNITRMPTTQREWNTFIQELSKWIKNETGNFDISSTDTAKFTGFSTDPTSANIWYQRYGQMVHMEFHFELGTSDATGFTITGIPETIRPRDNTDIVCRGLVDSGSLLDSANPAIVTVGSNGTLSFFSTGEHGAWTGSSSKGFITSGRYSIIYSLRQPGKH